MTNPARATSARSFRKALNAGSGGFEGPLRAKESPPVGVGVSLGLADDWPVARSAGRAGSGCASEGYQLVAGQARPLHDQGHRLDRGATVAPAVVEEHHGTGVEGVERRRGDGHRVA